MSNQNIQKISEIINENIEVKDGLVVEPNKDTNKKIVESFGHDYETYEKYKELDNETIAAFTKVVGEKGVDLFAEDENLKQVSGKLPMGNGNYTSVSVARERTYPNPQDRDNPITSYGATTTNYVAAGTVKKGDIKKIKEEIMENAKKRYGRG